MVRLVGVVVPVVGVVGVVLVAGLVGVVLLVELDGVILKVGLGLPACTFAGEASSTVDLLVSAGTPVSNSKDRVMSTDNDGST